ncbi:MAG: anti-sigma factor domain-containing protein [Solirubrobacteraceae bacterium]
MSDPACDQHPQAAAYLLGALNDTEAERYREHLKNCASCQEDIEQLRPVAHALATTPTPVVAAEPLIERVMANVRAEADLLNAAGPQADRPTPTKTRWRQRRLALLAGATSIAAATAIAVILATGGPSPKEHVTQASLAANTPGHAQVRQSGARAELLVTGIPQPPAGEIYEVWLAKPHGTPQPTDALFSVTTHGNASVDVPGNLHGIKTLMVTVEPAGGSQHPTNPPIITANLKTA